MLFLICREFRLIAGDAPKIPLPTATRTYSEGSCGMVCICLSRRTVKEMTLPRKDVFFGLKKADRPPRNSIT
jgi:hypothetical protein